MCPLWKVRQFLPQEGLDLGIEARTDGIPAALRRYAFALIRRTGKGGHTLLAAITQFIRARFIRSRRLNSTRLVALSFGVIILVGALLLTLPAKTGLTFNLLSLVVLFLNGAVFAALGVVISFLARSHADVPRFSNYFIMPMAYLCNTFFSSDTIPHGLREFIAALPLSQASRMVRAIAYGQPAGLWGIGVLLAYLAVLGAAGLWFVYKKKNL